LSRGRVRQVFEGARVAAEDDPVNAAANRRIRRRAPQITLK